MAVPDEAGQFTVSGVSGTQETWAFGWWIHDAGDNGTSDIDTVSVPWQAFRDELLSDMSTDQVMTRIDYRRYMGGVVTRHDQTTVNHAGTSSADVLPLQVACVMTLRSATLNRRGRGRMYLPTCSTIMMSSVNHLFASTRVNALVDKLAAWFTAEAGGSLTPVVMSRTGSAMHPITSVDADYVPDTQRRRRNQQQSARHSHAV